MTPRFLTSAASASDFPADDGAEVAVAGVSNSGKSSAINRLVGARKLARVSKTPGRTQLINFFELGPGKRLVDLPGYGYARVPVTVQRNWQQLLEAYFEGRTSLRGLILTMDIRRGFKALDLRMIEFAEHLDVPVLGLLTKADKLSRGRAASQLHSMAREAPDRLELVLFSSLSGQGVDDARKRLNEWLELGGRRE